MTMTPVGELRRRGRTTPVAFSVAVYALSRLLQLAALWLMSPDGTIRDRLLAWDGGHFVRVAEEGYPSGYSYDAAGNMVGNGLAFFPGYPMLVRLVHLVTRVDYGTAAITVSWLAGGAAAVLLCALGTCLYDQRVGLALTALFCVQPMSMALSMAYSEALFTALVAGMLLCAHRGVWLPAGLLGLAAGLTRPTGAAAAIALAVAAGIAVHRSRAAARSALRPDANSGFRVAVNPDRRADAHADLRPDVRPGLRADAASGLRMDARSALRADPHPELRADAHSGLRADAHSGLRADAHSSDLRADAYADLRADADRGLRADADPDVRADAHSGLHTDAGSGGRGDAGASGLRADAPSMDAAPGAPGGAGFGVRAGPSSDAALGFRAEAPTGRHAAPEPAGRADAAPGSRREARPTGAQPGRPAPVWKPLLAAVIALAGVPAYLLWVGLRVGDLSAWFKIQTAGWGTTFDYGSSSLQFVRDALLAGDGWIQVSIAWMLIATVILAAVALCSRVWPPLAVYGVIVLVLVLGQAGYYHSKPRLLVPALLVLVPPAVALGRARPRTAALVLAACGAFGLWYGSYLITVWHYAI